MAKTTISHNEYLQLVALLYMARKREQFVNEIAGSIHELLTGQPVIEPSDINGNISDEIWGFSDGGGNADRLLKAVKITVEPAATSDANS